MFKGRNMTRITHCLRHWWHRPRLFWFSLWQMLCRAIQNSQISQKVFRTPIHDFPLVSTPTELVRNVLIERLNDNAAFLLICKELGIATPDSSVCRGRREIGEAVDALVRLGHMVKLRLARSLGGLGNRTMHSVAEVLAFLDKEGQKSPWLTQEVRVEQLFAIKKAMYLGSILRIGLLGPVLLGHLKRNVVESNKLVGCEFPALQLPKDMQRVLTEKSLGFGWYLWEQGYQGSAGIDWGVTEDNLVIAFEAKCPYLPTNIGLAIRDQLKGGKGFFISHDCLKVGSSIDLNKLLWDLGEREKLLFDPNEGFGVVITTPPCDQKMAVVILADTAEEAKAMSKRLLQYLDRTFAEGKLVDLDEERRKRTGGKEEL